MNGRQKLVVSVPLLFLLLMSVVVAYVVLYRGDYLWIIYVGITWFAVYFLMALFAPRIKKWSTKS